VKVQKPRVCIVILNYNGFDDSKACLASVSDLDYHPFNVVLVDNASKDNSFERLRKAFPEIHCVRSEVNLGFTGGNNLGFKVAHQYSPRYVLFLNNDTVVSRNLLTELAGYLETHPDTGLVGPLACYYHDPERVAFAGGHLNRNTGLISFPYRDSYVEEIRETVVPCTFVEGTALFIRADLMERIGGFNDMYFLTSEESELCVKVADSGHRMAVITTCQVRHKISSSMGRASEVATYFIYRNKLFFVENNCRNFRCSDLAAIIRYYCCSFLSLVVKKRNYRAARGLATGVLDYIARRSGPGRFEALLS
jgi:hypothetical protein